MFLPGLYIPPYIPAYVVNPYPIRFRPGYRERIEALVEAGEFDSIADFVHEAISLFLYYREVQQMMALLLGEGGAEILKEIIHEELQNRKRQL